jgi:hypothetical protein
MSDLEKFRETFNEALTFIYAELTKINAMPRSREYDEPDAQVARDGIRDGIEEA